MCSVSPHGGRTEQLFYFIIIVYYLTERGLCSATVIISPNSFVCSWVYFGVPVNQTIGFHSTPGSQSNSFSCCREDNCVYFQFKGMIAVILSSRFAFPGGGSQRSAAIGSLGALCHSVSTCEVSHNRFRSPGPSHIL